MKLHDETVVLWDFSKLFPGNHCVWADIDYPDSNLKQKKFCVSSISISSVEPHKDLHGGARLVSFVIYEDIAVKRADREGGLYSMNLAHTLKAKGAYEEGFIPRGSLDGWWEMKNGEQFTDAAIRIGKCIFKMMNVRIEGQPAVLEGILFSLFVVYKVTWVRYGPGNNIRFNDYLRREHGLLNVDPATLRMKVF